MKRCDSNNGAGFCMLPALHDGDHQHIDGRIVVLASVCAAWLEAVHGDDFRDYLDEAMKGQGFSPRPGFSKARETAVERIQKLRSGGKA